MVEGITFTFPRHDPTPEVDMEMSSKLHRYLPLGLREDREKDRRLSCGRWSLGRTFSLAAAALVALLFLFNFQGNV